MEEDGDQNKLQGKDVERMETLRNISERCNKLLRDDRRLAQGLGVQVQSDSTKEDM